MSNSGSKQEPKAKSRASVVLPWLMLLVIVVLSLIAIMYFVERLNQIDDISNEVKKQAGEEPSAPSFVGTSEQLKQTLIVPTLETSIPANKSAIWCATTSLAWKELHELAGGDVTIGNQAELSQQLNNSITLKPGLEEKDYYAKAGLISKGIYQQIRRGLAAKGFSKIKPPVPDPTEEEGVVTFACLEVAMKYAHAFLNDDEPLKFLDGQGKKTNVKSFGIRTKDDPNAAQIRGQAFPYFHDGQGHYAVDVSSEMKPYQVIVACVERGSNLRACTEDFQRRTKQQIESKKVLYLGPESILSIPNMEWEITHTFDGMIDKTLLGKSLPKDLVMRRALQWMHLKMDRTGMIVVARTEMTSSITDGDEIHHHPAGHFIFDHPYMLMIQRRGQNDPFFVMWVDNAELLQKR